MGFYIDCLNLTHTVCGRGANRGDVKLLVLVRTRLIW